MNPNDLICVAFAGFMIIFAIAWVLQIINGIQDLRWGFPREHKLSNILGKLLLIWFIIMFSLVCLAFAFR